MGARQWCKQRLVAGISFRLILNYCKYPTSGHLGEAGKELLELYYSESEDLNSESEDDASKVSVLHPLPVILVR